MTESSDEPRQVNRLLGDVAAHMTAPVSYCDEDFRYVWVTDAIAEMLGSTKSNMEGRLIPGGFKFELHHLKVSRTQWASGSVRSATFSPARSDPPCPMLSLHLKSASRSII